MELQYLLQSSLKRLQDKLMKITCDFVKIFHDGKVNADNDYHPIDSRYESEI